VHLGGQRVLLQKEQKELSTSGSTDRVKDDGWVSLPMPGSGLSLLPAAVGASVVPGVIESQNRIVVGAGRDLCGSSSPTLLLKQGHLQQAAQDLVQAGHASPEAESAQPLHGAFPTFYFSGWSDPWAPGLTPTAATESFRLCASFTLK